MSTANVADRTPPGILRLLRMMYWSVRRDRRVIPHLGAVLIGFVANYVRFRVEKWRTRGRGSVAIALVEHLGDIVAAEPISRFARRQFPAAHVAWITRRAYAEVPHSYPAVDRVVTVGCLTEWMLLWSAGVADDVLDLHINGRMCPRCCIPLAKTGEAGQLSPDSYYAFGNLLTVQCVSAGLAPITGGPTIGLALRASKRIDDLCLPKCFVVVHCASNEAVRDWPEDKWRLLTDHITGILGLDVVEIGLAPRIVRRSRDKERSLCGQISICETAEVIRRAALFIGIDSGPAHLANAVGTQGIILLGQYKSFAQYMPYSGGYENGSKCDVIRADGPVASLPTEPVIAAITRRMGTISVTISDQDTPAVVCFERNSPM